MQYNYSFEISAVILLGLLIGVFLLNQDFEFAKNRSYFTFLMASFLNCILNIASCIGLTRTDVFSNFTNDVICFLFFLSEAFVSPMYFRYIVNLCEPNRKRREKYAVGTMIPFIIFIGMLVSNPVFHLIYDMKDNSYSQGRMAWYGYFYIMLFLVASVFIALTAKKTIRGRNRYSVFLASLISISAIVFQYNFKHILLTSFSNAVILFMFFILIQNSDELRDKVTNVGNTRAFFLNFENHSNQDKPMKIITVDIHQASQLSDLFGYRNSNIILDEVGEFLTDLADEKRVFHISSNVFAVVIDDNKADADRVASEILVRFEKPWVLDGIDTMLTVNVASYNYPENVKDYNEFHGLNNYIKSILRKDVENNYLKVNSDITDRYLRTTAVDKALRNALQKKSLKVYFQPIFDIDNGRFSSLEALARMFDDELGFVSPDEFIEAAENNGMIIPLDLMILEKTCEFIADQIIPNQDMLDIETVHVNISALQCLQPNMDEMILSIIDRCNVPRKMITLEITERATISAAELMQKHMLSLKDKGVKFALDDYGTGNSNCSYLIDYPFDEVKFDKNMIWAYFSTKRAEIILDGEMKNIHNLEIPIVAEGIENEIHLDAMKKLGVQKIQGYHYSRPLPPDQVIEFLISHAKK